MRRGWLIVGCSAVVHWTAILGLWSAMASPSYAQDAAVEKPAAEQEPPADVDKPGEEKAAAEEPPAEEKEPASQPASAPVQEEPATPAARLESDFVNYLNFVLVGQFAIADKHGQALLKHPDLSPKLTPAGIQMLLALTDKYEKSTETLILMANNEAVAENARKVLALIEQAQKFQRMNPERIKENIKLLSGTPTQRALAMERLADSGEYAVPWMLDVLADPQQRDLQPFVVRALPKLGRRALNPLIEALGMANDEVRSLVAQALGTIGYPQALPYLQRLAADKNANASLSASATSAIKQIVVSDPGLRQKSAIELFNDLGEQYYADVDSLRPDPREDRANVWFLRDNVLTPIEVPRQIYSLVMCQRCCESSLKLGAGQPQPVTVALWLAANFRREARLGLDVESEQPAQSDDLTRPPDFPRGVYFARSAGPSYCQIALARGLKDRDRAVALGAVAALNVTAGPATLVVPQDKQGISLADALAFPDALVRIRAALALGRAMPQSTFRGAEQVVPVLASALSLTGKKYYMVVDPQAALRDRIAQGLTATNATVVSAAGLPEALKRASTLTHMDGIFVGSDLKQPAAIDVIRELLSHPRFGLSPIVLMVKHGDSLVAERLASLGAPVGSALIVSDERGNIDPKFMDLLMARHGLVAGRLGYRSLSPELCFELAMRSAITLRSIAARPGVFNPLGAERSLVEALSHPSQELRVASAAALALLDSPTAQQAIAAMALDETLPEALRIPAFSSLAESARRFGARLDTDRTDTLIKQVIAEPNLAVRTAASQALGAMNLPGDRAAEVILAQPPH